jgi:hypothetical protein
MSRDAKTLEIFENTDDALQGVWAYSAFSTAAYNLALDDAVADQLPTAT